MNDAIQIPELDRIDARYNGDYDTLPDHPVVTWADEELSCAVRKLLKHVNRLEARIQELEGPYKGER